MRPAARYAIALLCGLLVTPAVAAAQAAQSTARAISMGRSLTASARGYEAIAWNPALLGMPDRPGFSLNIVQLGVNGRSNALGPSDILGFWGQDSLTVDDKNRILTNIRNTSDSTLGFGVLVDATAIAFTYRNFGVSLSGPAVDMDVAVSDDAVELALFGNVTRRGPGERYLAAGSRGRGVSAATLSLAWGQAIAVPIGHLAVGATAKFTRGILAAGAQDNGSYVQNAPDFTARADGEVLLFDPDSSLNNGFGFGMDIGGAYDFVSGIRVALAIENLFSTMSWKDEKLLYYRRAYALTQSGAGFTYSDSTIADVEQRYDPTDPAQAALRDSIFGGSPFPTRARLGAQLALGPVLLAGDLAVQLKEGLVPGEKQRFSAGAEVPLSVVYLRAGLATDFKGGYGFSGGLGFKLGPVRLDFAGATTPGGPRQGLWVATGISIMD